MSLAGILPHFFLRSRVENDGGILLMSHPSGPDCGVTESGLIPTLREVSSGARQPELRDVGGIRVEGE